MARPGKRMVNRSPPRSSGVHDSQKILLQNGQWATCAGPETRFLEKPGFLPIQCISAGQLCPKRCLELSGAQNSSIYRGWRVPDTFFWAKPAGAESARARTAPVAIQTTEQESDNEQNREP